MKIKDMKRLINGIRSLMILEGILYNKRIMCKSTKLQKD